MALESWVSLSEKSRGNFWRNEVKLINDGKVYWGVMMCMPDDNAHELRQKHNELTQKFVRQFNVWMLIKPA